MDKINVSDASLQSAIATLERLRDFVDGASADCEAMLLSLYANLDEKLREDIDTYISQVKAFKNSIGQFVDENISAIRERLAKIPEYEKKTYKKRNIN